MKYSLIFCCLILSGCVTVPAKPKWPDAPDVGSCSALLEAQSSEKLSELLKIVSANYGKYHECTARVEAWQQWYEKQKKIYEEAK